MSEYFLNQGNWRLTDNGKYTINGFLATIVLTVVCILLGFWLFARWTDSFIKPRPQEIKDPSLPPDSEIVGLYIYPVKSCRGISVESARLKLTGLEFDRNWMFVDAATNKFLTIRQDPTMTLIHTALSDDYKKLRISVKDNPDCEVTIDSRPDQEWLQSNCKLIHVEIWGDETDAWEYPYDINTTFSKHFSKPVKLVFKGPRPRPSSDNATAELYGKDAPHMFADDLPVQIASEASLADLNARFKEANPDKDELGMTRFRPNIVVAGRSKYPWEEDNWKRVRLVTTNHETRKLWRLDLDVTNRCTRCQVPNVDPETAEKDDKEPWSTLIKFRRIDPSRKAKYKPCFGMLCVPKKIGEVRVGGKLEVLELTEKHEHSVAKFDEL